MRKLYTLFVLLVCVLATGTSANESASDFYEEANRAFNAEEIGKSYILLKNALSKNPEHLPSKLLMGRVLLMDGHISDATELLEEVWTQGGDVNLLLPSLARAYFIAGRYSDTVQLFENKDLSGNAKLQVGLIANAANKKLGNSDTVASILNQLAKEYTDTPAVLNALSSMYIDKGNIALARDFAERAMQIDSADANTWVQMGLVEQSEGHFEIAKQNFFKADQLLPDDPSTMRALAALLTEMGELDNAERYIAKISEQSPNDMQNKLLQARILALRKQQSQADSILRKLAESLSLMNDEQRNERLELSLITGIVAFINQNYTVASTELNRYVSQKTPNAEVLGLLAQSLLQQGYYDDAIRNLEKHLEIILDNELVAKVTCELYIGVKRAFKCENLLKQIEQKYPDSEVVALLKAQLFIEKLDFQQAMKVLESSSSTSLEVAELKVVILAKLGRFETAYKLAKLLVEQAPESLNYLNLLTDLAMRNGETNYARTLNSQVRKADRTNLAAQINYARLLFEEDKVKRAGSVLSKVLDEHKTNLSALVLHARLHMSQQDYEQAITSLLTAKSYHTKSITPRLLLIQIYREQGELSAALIEVNQLLNMHRLTADYIWQKAEILLAMNEQEEVVKQTRILYSLWTDNAANLIQLSQLQRQSQDLDGAEKSLQQAVKTTNGHPKSRMELVRFWIDSGNIALAKGNLKKLVKEFGQTANISYLQGLLALEEGKKAGAFGKFMEAHSKSNTFQLPLINMYELARAEVERQAFINYVAEYVTDNQNTFATHLLADILFLDESYSRATQLYKHLLVQDDVTREFAIYTNLATIESDNNLQQAMMYSEKAFELSPDSSIVLRTHGWLLAQNGNEEQGLDMLRKAYVLNADDPLVHYYLAQTLHKMGRHEEAYAALKDNGTLNSSFSKLQNAKALEQQLKQVTVSNK